MQLTEAVRASQKFGGVDLTHTLARIEASFGGSTVETCSYGRCFHLDNSAGNERARRVLARVRQRTFAPFSASKRWRNEAEFVLRRG
jgi:hypothetical protein